MITKTRVSILALMISSLTVALFSKDPNIIEKKESIEQRQEEVAEQKLPQVYTYKTINSFNDDQALKAFAECKKGDLILFDVCQTLIECVDVMARTVKWPIDFLKKFNEMIGVTEEEDRSKIKWKNPNFIFFKSIMNRDVKQFVMEPEIVDIINMLKEKGCIVLGLTGTEAGEYGVIPSINDWRYNILKAFGIEFSDTYPDTEFKELSKNPTSALALYNYPVLYKGMLCCNGSSNVESLELLVAKFKVDQSSDIAFYNFDDDVEKIKRLEVWCKQKGIPFYGYLYTRKSDPIATPGVWNEDRALMQTESLIKEKKWISDEEADRLVAEKKASE